MAIRASYRLLLCGLVVAALVGQSALANSGHSEKQDQKPCEEKLASDGNRSAQSRLRQLADQAVSRLYSKWPWVIPASLALTEIARAGHETQNGGSVVVDGVEYQLADLHFQALPYEGYTIDPVLRRLIEEFNKFIFNVGIYDGYESFTVLVPGEFGSFFSNSVFSEYVEFRLVSSLPSGCTPISSENLDPSLPVVHIGCTQGWITYVIPSVFSKLDPVSRALFILHERLHAYAPLQPLEIKADFIKAANVVLRKIIPNIGKDLVSDLLDEKELNVLRLLRRRAIQLSNEVKNSLPGRLVNYRFLKSGGFLWTSVERNSAYGSNNSIPDINALELDPSVEIGAGSSIGVDGFRDFGDIRSFKNSRLIGQTQIQLVGKLEGENNQFNDSRVIVAGSNFAGTSRSRLTLNRLVLKKNVVKVSRNSNLKSVEIGNPSGPVIEAKPGALYCIRPLPGEDPWTVVIRTREDLDRYEMEKNGFFCP